jgi:hypothetical protein
VEQGERDGNRRCRGWGVRCEGDEGRERSRLAEGGRNHGAEAHLRTGFFSPLRTF